MSDRSVWRRFMPRSRYAGAIGFCLVLILNLSLGRGVAQDSVVVSGTAPVAGFDPSVVAATDEALREWVARDGWVRVQVDLRQPAGDAVPPAATQAAIQSDDLGQTAQDLLFALPAGSYDAVQRIAGSSSLTLRVDAAGLDELLVSPLVAAVAAASNPGMQRIAGGDYHSLAIKPDGGLWAWGFNYYGQIGDGSPVYTLRLLPVQVLTGVVAVAAGGNHSLAKKTDGSLWGWGQNVFGQLGDGTTGSRLLPAQVQTGVAAVAAGSIHSLAIKTDGTLWAWGYNTYGAVGDGSNADRLRPVQVLTEVEAVTAGHDHSLALKTDGSLWAWGKNDYGQLGKGTTTPYSDDPNNRSPVQILTGVVAVAAGGNHSLAIRTDGSLWAWGHNSSGQFGDGSWADSATPVQVQTGFAIMAAGYAHTLAIKTDNSLWTWGYNKDGQLGDGTTTDSLSPIQVLTGVAAVAGNKESYYGRSLAFKTDGSLWAWGNNALGQLGDGTQENRLTPVQVSGFGPTTPQPDFVVTKVVLTPVNPIANGTFNAAVTVKNQGTVAGTPGTLQVWANQASVQGCSAVGDKSVVLTSLAAGASRTVTVSALPAGTAGVKTLRAFVDSTCQTAEANETNNQFTQAHTVASPAPDFRITDVVLTPATPIGNGTFSATVTVTNQGTLAGTPGTLQVWANQASVQACSAVGNKSATLASLAAGASQTVTLNGLPAGAAGAKTLRAFVDSKCQTAEPNEPDNQSTKTYTVAPPAADFVVTSVVLTPSGPIANATFSAAVTVKNQGTVAGTPGTLQVWANQPSVQVCNAVGNKSATLVSLAAGASRTVTLSGLPAGAAGAKTLRAFVDSKCQTAEPNEPDNQSTTAYTVFTRPTPDFVVTSIILTPSSPTASGTFSAAVTVKNQGSGSGDGGWLDVWANQPTSQTCPANGNAYASVGTLAAGASKILTVSGLPAGAAGTKTLRAFVDSYCGTTESSDGNNQTVKSYTVVP